eukprot:GCRY01001329.1.p1 GENE.GCRY01001329.1~~GCRY01001329.1.p1  ORF type:complete len:299 (-),score=51.92 GCRY01001329.1:278-1174(-)
MGKKKGKSVVGAVAGGLTGGIEAVVAYPTEYIKTQIQLSSVKTNSSQVIRSTLDKHGVLGFYRGLTPILFGSMLKVGVRFAAFEHASHLIDRHLNLENNPHCAHFLAGLFAGFCDGTFVVTPVETIKTKFISDLNRPVPRYRGLIHGVRSIVREEGIHGLYQGLAPTIVKQATNQAVRFAIVDVVKTAMAGGCCQKKKELPAHYTLLAGALAGVTSVVANNPVDVVKTRMQSVEAHAQYRSSLHCFSKTLKQEGLMAFYKGSGPRMARVVLNSAVVFTSYDTMKALVTPLLSRSPDHM